MKRALCVLSAIMLCAAMSGCSVVREAAVDVMKEVLQEETPVPTQENVIEVTPERIEFPKATEEVVMTAAPTQEATPVPAPVQSKIVCTSALQVFSKSQEAYLRDTGTGNTGDFAQLSADEFFTPAMVVKYSGEGPLKWSELCVTVDDGEKWGWTAGELPSGSEMKLHIYNVNMEKIGEGTHTVKWYLDGEELWRDTFTLKRETDWDARCEFPTQAEIEAHNETATQRSPYMSMWLDIPDRAHYNEYTIEFKADHAPKGSYFAIGNFMMDYSSLEKQYKKVYTEYGITGYAGFQNIYNGKKICIMSVWDVYCEDSSGKVTTIRAKQTYPEDAYKSGEFGGEGVGAQCLVEYDWQANHWYRARLKCSEGANGNTQLEFFVTDLETGEETLLCAYDMGAEDLAFRGPNCIFLENYIVDYSGDVRTMEVRNARYCDAETGAWHGIEGGDMNYNGGALQMGYAGSFDYGVDGDRIWIMTTGVGSQQDSSAGKHLEFGK